MIIHTLKEIGKTHPPNWLVNKVQYLTIIGSEAYGVTKDESDHDIYGFVIPPKEEIFPHLKGEIPNFGSIPEGLNNGRNITYSTMKSITSDF